MIPPALLKWGAILLGLLLLMMLLRYALTVNTITLKGTEIVALEREIRMLEDENARLRLVITVHQERVFKAYRKELAR